MAGYDCNNLYSRSHASEVQSFFVLGNREQGTVNKFVCTSLDWETLYTCRILISSLHFAKMKVAWTLISAHFMVLIFQIFHENARTVKTVKQIFQTVKPLWGVNTVSKILLTAHIKFCLSFNFIVDLYLNIGIMERFGLMLILFWRKPH